MVRGPGDVKLAERRRRRYCLASPLKNRGNSDAIRMLSWLLHNAIQIYSFIVIAHVVLNLLVAFQVVNPRVPIVMQIGRILYRLSEPALAPIRRFLPAVAGIDLSPLVLLLLLQLVGGWIVGQLLIAGL
jgi:YggT family protein